MVVMVILTIEGFNAFWRDTEIFLPCHLYTRNILEDIILSLLDSLYQKMANMYCVFMY